MFKKDDLSNIYVKFLSDKLKEIKFDDIPVSYQEGVQINIISEEEFILGKVKYDDKILHRSILIKYFTED